MPDSPTRDLIKEEEKHLQVAQDEAEKHPDATAAMAAAGHAEQQVRRAVTIQHYQHILDATLRNVHLDLLLPEILQRIRTLLEADEATLYLTDETGRDLRATASVGLEQAVKAGLRIPVGHGIAGVVLASAKSRTLYDVNEEAATNPFLANIGIRSLRRRAHRHRQAGGWCSDSWVHQRPSFWA